MVKSGQQATIDVGTEVPTVSSNSQSTTNSDAPILQSIQYRKTGVRLTVSPVVHASGHVDIEIEQELSEGRQMFVVCPLITAQTESGEPTPAQTASSAEKVYENFNKGDFKHRRVGLLHGGGGCRVLIRGRGPA